MDTRRAYNDGLEVRAAADGRREIVGVAIRYGTVTQPILGLPEFRERILAGAFAESLKNPVRDIAANWNHDRTFQLGSYAAGTLRFTDTPAELRFSIRVFPQFDWVVDMVESGEARGASVEMAQVEFRRDAEGGALVESIEKATLRGLAVVNAPAYTDAYVEVAKRALEEFRAEQDDDEDDDEEKDRKGDHGKADERAQQEAMLVVEDILAGNQIAPEGAEKEAPDA